MATILYLPSSGAGAVTPTPSATDWDGHVNSINRPLNFTRADTALATVAYSPDAVDHLADLATMHTQFVSQLLPPQTIAAQQITFGARCLEAASSNNLFPAWKLYGCNASGSSNLGNLVAWFKSATAEMSTSITGYCETRVGSAVTFTEPWRLVFEVGADGLPVNTATDTHNHSWAFGDPMATGSQNLPQQADTTACTPCLIFSNDIDIKFFLRAPTLNLGV